MRGIEEVHIESGVGKFITGQKYTIWKPSRWRGDGTKPLVSLQHGTLGDGYTFLANSVRYIPLLIAGMYGFPVIAGDQDGLPNAGPGKSEANDASQANAWSAITQAQTKLGTKTGAGSVVAVGTSMGSHLTWCLHRSHQTEITHSIHCLVTVSATASYNANDPNFQFTQYADAAYSDVVGGWPAAAPTHDPGLFYPDFTNGRFVLMDTVDDPTNGGQNGVNQLAGLLTGTGKGNQVETHFYGTGGHDITKISYDEIARLVAKYSGVA